MAKKKKPGNQPLVFEDGQYDKFRKQVKALAGHGLKNEEISEFTGIKVTSLKKYFQKELSIGRITAHLNVKQTAYRLAASGMCPPMTMFYLKTQCGWREKDPEQNNSNFDPTKLSTDDLRAIAKGKNKGVSRA